MENGQPTGKVSVDRDGQGQLNLARNQIVISDDAGDVICIIPYYRDDDGKAYSYAERNEYEELAETIVKRLNATEQLIDVARDVLDLLTCNCVGQSYTYDPAKCEGTCTHGMARRALAELKDGAQ